MSGNRLINHVNAKRKEQWISTVRYETVQSERVGINQQTYWSQECLPNSKFDQPQRSRVMSAKQWEVQEPESSIYERNQSTTEGRVEFSFC